MNVLSDLRAPRLHLRTVWQAHQVVNLWGCGGICSSAFSIFRRPNFTCNSYQFAGVKKAGDCLYKNLSLDSWTNRYTDQFVLVYSSLPPPILLFLLFLFFLYY